MDVCHSEILFQAVSEEFASEVQENPKLLVGDFQRDEIVSREFWVQIRLDDT